MSHESCPLTPALLNLLQLCATHHTRESKRLGEILGRSPHTIDTEFYRIFQILGVHNRLGVVLLALEKGWIQLGAEGGREEPTRESAPSRDLRASQD